MEKVYKVEKTELFNIKNKFDEYRSELKWNENEHLPNTEDDIKNLLGFAGNDEEFERLEESVDVKSLCNHASIIIEPFKIAMTRMERKVTVEVPSQALNLSTFRKVLECEIKKERKLFGNSVYVYKHIPAEYSSPERDLTPFEDVVISVRFYWPFCHIAGYHVMGPRFAAEFLVLGSQKLSELRDKIDCVANNGPIFDISKNLNQEMTGHTANSGFFFITDTFYNDTRLPENSDYSKEIREWAEMRKNDFPTSFKTRKMEEATFNELNIRLGFPHVYMHQGNCEHLFTFSSIHLLAPTDHLLRADYPLKKSVSFPKTILCNICGDREYGYMVKNSKKHLHEITYLCRTCLERFHYVDGKKVGEFEVYKLNDNEIIDVIPVDDVE